MYQVFQALYSLIVLPKNLIETVFTHKQQPSAAFCFILLIISFEKEIYYAALQVELFSPGALVHAFV